MVYTLTPRQVPTWSLGLESIPDLPDEEISKTLVAMLPEITGDAEAWNALGDDFHARLWKNYPRWAKGYIRWLGCSFPIKDRSLLKNKRLDWTIGATSPAQSFMGKQIDGEETS